MSHTRRRTQVNLQKRAANKKLVRDLLKGKKKAATITATRVNFGQAIAEAVRNIPIQQLIPPPSAPVGRVNFGQVIAEAVRNIPIQQLIPPPSAPVAPAIAAPVAPAIAAPVAPAVAAPVAPPVAAPVAPPVANNAYAVRNRVEANNNNRGLSNEEYQTLIQTLSEISFQPQRNSACWESNNWADADTIYGTLQRTLGEKVHLIRPDLFTAVTIFDEEGAVECAKTLCGGFKIGEDFQLQGDIYASQESALTKPIVLILNTQSVLAENELATQTEGGSHWFACIILPPHYHSPSGEMNANDQCIIYCLDSLGGIQALPPRLKKILRKGKEHTFETQEHAIVRHQINGRYRNATFIEGISKAQQHGGSDCGYWAMFNAIMLVHTGSHSFLNQFSTNEQEPPRAPGFALRYSLGSLWLPPYHSLSNLNPADLAELPAMLKERLESVPLFYSRAQLALMADIADNELACRSTAVYQLLDELNTLIPANQLLQTVTARIEDCQRTYPLAFQHFYLTSLLSELRELNLHYLAYRENRILNPLPLAPLQDTINHSSIKFKVGSPGNHSTVIVTNSSHSKNEFTVTYKSDKQRSSFHIHEFDPETANFPRFFSETATTKKPGQTALMVSNEIVRQEIQNHENLPAQVQHAAALASTVIKNVKEVSNVICNEPEKILNSSATIKTPEELEKRINNSKIIVKDSSGAFFSKWNLSEDWLMGKYVTAEPTPSSPSSHEDNHNEHSSLGGILSPINTVDSTAKVLGKHILSKPFEAFLLSAEVLERYQEAPEVAGTTEKNFCSVVGVGAETLTTHAGIAILRAGQVAAARSGVGAYLVPLLASASVPSIMAAGKEVGDFSQQLCHSGFRLFDPTESKSLKKIISELPELKKKSAFSTKMIMAGMNKDLLNFNKLVGSNSQFNVRQLAKTTTAPAPKPAPVPPRAPVTAPQPQPIPTVNRQTVLRADLQKRQAARQARVDRIRHEKALKMRQIAARQKPSMDVSCRFRFSGTISGNSAKQVRGQLANHANELGKDVKKSVKKGKKVVKKSKKLVKKIGKKLGF